MCVRHLNKEYFRHRPQVYAALHVSRHGRIGGNKQQTVRMLQIQRKLTFSISCQFMAPRGRQVRHIRKVRCGTKFCKALPQSCRHDLAKSPFHLPSIRADFLESSVLEEYAHPRLTMLTQRVNLFNGRSQCRWKSVQGHRHELSFLCRNGAVVTWSGSSPTPCRGQAQSLCPATARRCRRTGPSWPSRPRARPAA